MVSGRLGPLLGGLGVVLAGLGPLLGCLVVVFGGLGAFLGVSWGGLVRSWGSLDQPLGIF